MSSIKAATNAQPRTTQEKPETMSKYLDVSVTTDVVLLVFDQRLKVLLIERRFPPYQGAWALPGGFLDAADATLEAGALRELQEETGVTLSAQRLFSCGSYGDVNRDPRARTVTAAYCAVVGPNEVSTATAGDDAGKLAFFNVQELPPLAFDHRRIIENALFEAKLRLAYIETDADKAKGKSGVDCSILPVDLCAKRREIAEACRLS